MLIAFLISLGRWQLRRADEKRVLFDSFASGSDATLSVDLATPPLRRYQHLEAGGHYDQSRQILVDNMFDGERVGYYVITPFALDEGETIGALLSHGPPMPAVAHQFSDSKGFTWLSEDDFVKHFVPDVEESQARALFAVQQPLSSSVFGDVMGVPAWKNLPSWYLVTLNDEVIPPDAQRQFAGRMNATTVEIPSSHPAMISHPGEVADLISKAAESCGGSG